MFSKQHGPVLPDFSPDLRDEHDWKVGPLRTLDFPLNVTTLAIEPIASLLAAGTANGNIHIFGRPGVHCKITLPQPVEVRLLQFSISTFNIVCLDGNNQLHVHNLSEFGKPKLVDSARFDPVNSMTLSPSHSHVFVATQNGDIKTYDLTCLRKSPYNIPNLWKLYEEKLAGSGIPLLTPPAPLNAVESVIHPRNLDLMFVAYDGGVVLTGLTERNTIRAYELVLSPGAPGGAGYGTDDILTHRRMMVSSIAVHPSGHFFAVGHADGSIAFWAVEDDDKPLLVRTLDTTDVNLVDASQLDRDEATTRSTREPIFKLSWSSFANSSDPRGGDTTLAILGGLDVTKPPGLTLFLLPAFNPAEPPAEPPAPSDSLHPFFRNAMCQSLSPIKSFFYETGGVVQDYLLVPHTSPHLSGSFDPAAVLLIIESEGMRTVEAYQYPPPGFIQLVQASPSVPRKSESEEHEEGRSAAAAGLLSPPPPTPLPKSPRHLNHTPLPFRIPIPLQNGHSGILGASIFKVNNEIYQDFNDKRLHIDHYLKLKGGQAHADTTKSNVLKLSKYQPHRILMTYNRDLSIRTFDISNQLLIPSGAPETIEHEWPEPLPALIIRLDDIFDDPAIVEIIASPVDKIVIDSVQVAPEALEYAIALKSGEIIVYHPSSNQSSSRIITDTEIVLLDHIHSPLAARLTPYFIFAPGKGPVLTFALSDIGFLAVSYNDGSLFVIDMRGPKIILSQRSDKKTKRAVATAMLQHPTQLPAAHVSGPDVIKSLQWTVSSLENDPRLDVRLVAAHQSGQAEIFTLNHSGEPISWKVAGESVSCKAVPDPIPYATFVLDSKTGAQSRADRARLAASFKGEASVNGSRPSLLLTVGAKGARCSMNINGSKVAKVEWGHKGAVQGAHIVEHMESRALLLQTDRHEALIYSLPHLEYLHTLQLAPTTSLPLTIDDSGDYIAWTLSPQAHSTGVIHSATYGTFFDVRRAYTLPDIDFAVSRGPIPSQPQPVSLGPPSVLSSWFSFNQTKSGEQIDELLGGPNRPVMDKVNLDEFEGPSSSGTAAGLIAGATAVQTNIYNTLASAMSERGQLLGDLEDRFNSLEEGSRSMVAQAKRLATQQTAKSWFGF